MARPSVTALILAMMVLAVIPMPASAGDSGGVQASESSVGISPQSPVEGGSVIITLTLQNTNNFHIHQKWPIFSKTFFSTCPRAKFFVL